ncbi:MAG: CaiB/BaiF CoA transferase family protein [Burkholderiaceae bacterium]
MRGPLDGVRVLDLTTVLMGPYATQTLGEYGAEVIKIEGLAGDLVRDLGPTRNPGMGAVFLNTNRSKQSISIDLKAAAGREVVHRLMATVDVFVTNVRPRALAKLGLAADTLVEQYPRLICANLVGYDQRGPYAGRPAYDDLIQGGSGFSDLMARASSDIPRYAPNAMADRVVGLTAVGAVTSALYAREKTGQGQAIEIPMFETMTHFVMSDHLGGHTYSPSHGPAGYARHLSPDRRPLQTSDGYLCALVYNDQQWERFLKTMDLLDWFDKYDFLRHFERRAERIDQINEMLSSLFLTRTTDQWIEILEQADVPYMQMHTLDSILTDPQLAATDFFREVEHPSEGRLRQMRTPVQWSRTPVEETKPVPRLGEQTVSLLEGVGYTAAEITTLRADGAVYAAPDDAPPDSAEDA